VRVACAGGGPAGLFLALLLRRQGGHEVVVYDRNPPGADAGFGVVFSRLGLARLRSIAPEVADTLLGLGTSWSDLHVQVGADRVTLAHHDYAAVGRTALLGCLRAAAERAGARLVPGTEVTAEDLLGDHDLVVAADGAGSRVRAGLADELGTSVEPSDTRYAWLGADRAFPAMTFLFARTEHGWVSAHVYPYTSDRSTFLVEVGPGVWRRAGLAAQESAPAAAAEQAALAFCQDAFAGHLRGARLLGNRSRWLAFPAVHNERWSAGRVVLVGDAAHTAHFSVGSGTTLAMEDAAVLARCLAPRAGESSDAGDGLDRRLADYERRRRPAVAAVQSAGWASSQLWRQLDDQPELDATALALKLLTRTAQVTTGMLVRGDRELPDRLRRPLSGPPPAATLPTLTSGAGADGEPLLHVRSPGPGPPVAVLAELPAGSDGAEARLGRLREQYPDRPVGLLLRAGPAPAGPPVPAADAVRALCRRCPPDVLAVARSGLGPVPEQRAGQMVACEELRPLGPAIAYAAPAEDVEHGWTHVQAMRADHLWISC
jgi:anthraniloyl-CoA monooxygenase